MVNWYKTITVKVNTANSLSNTATVSGSENDPNQANNTVIANNSVSSPSIDLSLTKTANANAILAGSNLIYTLSAKNLGAQAATSVKIVDTLPGGGTFVSAGTGCVNASGTVTCSIGNLVAGATASRTITIKTSAAGTLTNTATVSALESDPNQANNTATASTTVNPPMADLSLTKTANAATVLVGTNVAYTLTAKNNGPQVATSVKIVDTLPAGVTFVSAGTGCINASGTVTCTIGNLANAGTASRTITVKPTAPGSLINTATVSGIATDPNSGNSTATAITTVSINCANVTEIPQTECAALVKLFSTTNGAGWTNSIGWLQNNTPCSWYGITCAGGRVTEIGLHNNLLKGTIPTELGNLTALTRVWLWMNQLTGAIPSSLGNLTQLTGQGLLLNDNQLSGTIPSTLGNLKKVQHLWLHRNKLTGSIPTSLGTMTALQGLLLGENLLTGGIPTALSGLANLESLWLNNNGLTGPVPAVLANLTKLKQLLLASNPLSGSLPASFVNLQLTDLTYQNTTLCEPQDATFQNWLSTITVLGRSGLLCGAPPA